MFITVEGMEGAGKSAVLSGLVRRLQGAGVDIMLTREPGGCTLGDDLRPLLLRAGRQLDPVAELFLFQADRAQHVAEVIRPALEAGTWVLCDRYADSTTAYQGYGRGLDLGMLQELSHIATGGLSPDMTLLLDIEPEQGLERAMRRNQQLGLSESEGRFETEQLAFHSRVRQGFLALAAQEPERFVVLDSSRPLEEVQNEAWRAVTGRSGLEESSA